MKTQIDLKSALLGMTAGILAMFAIGAGTSSEESGRYQVSVGTSSAIIVDTKTGQAWGYAPINTAQYRNDGSFFEPKKP
jgi:hypothetical protein